MADDKIFDSVFKTMLAKAPQLLVPFINEAFGRNYPPNADIVRLSTDHEGPLGARTSDSVFQLGGRLYHIECQSTPDADMAVRMIEYDFAIALEATTATGPPYEMNLPASCVLFLRHNASTPDELSVRVNLPDGGSFDYKTRVVKAQNYTGNELFEKDLLLLLPYYLMRYEHDLGRIAADDALAEQLIAEIAQLHGRLEAVTLAAGEALLYKDLVELIIRINDYLLKEKERLRERARGIMGGEVLELLTDRVERAEREARQAREQGIAQGMRNMEEALTAKLREQGVDEALLAEATAAVLAESRSS